MKRILILSLVALMLFSCVACEFATEDDVINSTENESSNNESSTESSDESNNSDVVEPDVSEDSSVTEDSSDVSDETSTDNVIVKEITDIKITINGYSDLSKNGYTITSGSDKKVSVKLKGLESVLTAITAESVIASVDAGNISETGDIELLITYKAPDNTEIVFTSDSLVTFKIKRSSAEIVPPVVDEIRTVNGVLISGIRAMETFGGTASSGKKTAENLNKFKEEIGANVNLYVLPSPLASAFYAPVGYEKSITRHSECFYGMRDALVNVGFVDTLSVLSTHVSEDIYFRTDHHWQALAAYYAVEELCKVAGVPFDDLSTYKAYSNNNMLGSFYNYYTHDPVLRDNPDTMTWYEPTREHTVTYYSNDYFKNPSADRSLFSSSKSYTKFLGGDNTALIKTNVNNGRKLLMFKDSYGNACVPFLVGSFEEIIVTDYREFKLNAKEFIEEHGITDVCFQLAAFSVAGSKRDYIIDLLNY